MSTITCVLCKVLVHFSVLIGLFAFILLISWSYFYIINTVHLPDACIADVLGFRGLTVFSVFWWTEFWNLIKLRISVLFNDSSFECHVWKIFPYSKMMKILSCVVSSCLIIWGWLTRNYFCIWYELSVKVRISIWMCTCPSTVCWKDHFLSTELQQGLCSTKWPYIYVGLCLHCILFLWSSDFSFLPILHFCNYCCITVSHEIQ